MAFISFFLRNFPLISLIAAFVLGALARKKNQSYSEALVRFCLLLPVGFAGVWGFYFHAFMSELAANSIGWATSPFQFEVAVANLGIGIAGIVGFNRGWEYALAVSLILSIFLWGAAINHISEIITISNFSPGNAGSILLTDFLIPGVLWAALLRWKRTNSFRD